MEKDYLIKKLKLSELIIKNDKQAIEVAKEFTNLTQEQTASLVDLINKFMDSDHALMLKEVISVLDIEDKDYLLDILDLKQLSLFKDSKTFETVIREKIKLNKDYGDETKNYMYYSLIVNLVISSQNTELIKLAIDKLQEI